MRFSALVFEHLCHLDFRREPLVRPYQCKMGSPSCARPDSFYAAFDCLSLIFFGHVLLHSPSWEHPLLPSALENRVCRECGWVGGCVCGLVGGCAFCVCWIGPHSRCSSHTAAAPALSLLASPWLSHRWWLFLSLPFFPWRVEVLLPGCCSSSGLPFLPASLQPDCNRRFSL